MALTITEIGNNMYKFIITVMDNGSKKMYETWASNTEEAYIRANQYLIPYNNTVSIHSINKANNNFDIA